MNSLNLLNLLENDVLLYFAHVIGKLFLYVNVVFGSGLHQFNSFFSFFYFKPLNLKFFRLKFQNNGQAFIQSENI